MAVAREEGDQDGVAGVTAAWRLRLRRLLSEDPAAAAELRALLDEVAPGRASKRWGRCTTPSAAGCSTVR